jgi:hypothetical protein
MAREFDSLHVNLIGGPAPYKWEIRRGNQPGSVERSARDYPTESAALEDAKAALERLMNREALNKGA